MRVMLMTVGTGARVFDAITKSIDEADPDRLYFFGTEDSRATVAEVEKRLAEARIISQGAIAFVPIADPNEHMLVFEAVGEVVEAERRLGMQDRNFVIDYTSGTKAMSVGLALGATAFVPDASYRYVGSKVRDKQYGRVLSGEEDIKIRKSPYHYFAFSEERIAATLVNAGMFEEAARQVEAILYRNPSVKVRPRLTALGGFARALGAWDRFAYVAAARDVAALDAASLAHYGVTAAMLDDRGRFLEALCQQSAMGTGRDPVPSLELIADLLENMDRQAAAGRYADALLRGRRAAEMAVQYLAYSRHGLDTNEIDLDRLPASARSTLEEIPELVARTPKGVKIGFEATLRLIESLGDSNLIAPFRGERFRAALDGARLSILCYGYRSVENAAVVSELREAVLAILGSLAISLESTFTIEEALLAARFPVLKW